MSVFLIDLENVNLELFLKSRKFSSQDKFYLVGISSLKFAASVLEFLADKEYKFYSFNDAKKDYADKIILTILGSLLEKFKNENFFIVSNDGIFSELDFTKNIFSKKVENIKFNNHTTKETPVLKPQTETENKNIEILYNKNLAKIDEIWNKYKNFRDFHNNLVKEFGLEMGKNLYKFAKTTKKYSTQPSK